MTTRRLLLLGVPALLLAGCVGPKPHDLSTADVRSFRLVAVEGLVAPTGRLQWRRVVDEYAQAYPNSQIAAASVGAVAGTPSLHAFVQAAFDKQARETFGPVLQAELNGVRPVRAVVTLRSLMIYGVADGILIGLATGPVRSSLAASVDLVDAKTGAVLVRYPETRVDTQGGETPIKLGLLGRYSSDPMERLLAVLASDYARWLLKS